MPDYKVEFTVHGSSLAEVMAKVFSFAEEHGGADVTRFAIEEEK